MRRGEDASEEMIVGQGERGEDGARGLLGQDALRGVHVGYCKLEEGRNKKMLEEHPTGQSE